MSAYAGRVDAAAVPQHAILCDNLVKIYKTAELEVVALQGLDLVVEPGELIAVVGRLGERQVDAPEHPRRRRHADRRSRRGRGNGLDVPHRAPTDPVPPQGGRLRVAADGAEPPAVSDRRRERRAADDAGRRLRRRAGAPRSRAARARRARRTAPTTAPTRCPAASSSASPSRSRSRTEPSCSSPTSRRASSTRRLERPLRRRCAT